MTVAAFAPRIHVLMARKAPLALVIRRGPSKQVATLLWDRTRDRFKLGQWLKGRMYERRCDLSPDGRYFLYFAMNGKWDSEARGAWSAISRVPYLKALALFPKGDCWHGGGLWTGNRSYWLNDGYGHSVLRDTTLVHRDRKHKPAEYFGGECPGVYYHGLLRDGWSLTGRQRVGKWKDRDIFEKPISSAWRLRKIAHAEVGAPPGKGCYWDEHELIHVPSGRTIACPTWEWADLDDNRLVWTSDGKLTSARVGKQGLTGERELYDFNHMAFEAVEAPY
jgi:hypothetical protein